MDKVVAYRYEGAEVHTDEVATITVERGCGPRYGEFAPNGKDFYLINEIGSRVMRYRYNASKMTLCEETSTLPYGFTGENICSDLHITADGKFLYASNRGHDSITAYHIRGRQPCLDRVPVQRWQNAPQLCAGSHRQLPVG